MMDYNIRNGRTYMYFKGQPLYPFGFGLSYTTFAYSNLRPSSSHMAKDGQMNVTVSVRNTGKRDGQEVVQFYLTHRGSKVERPIKELKGFQRVSLKAGETKVVLRSEEHTSELQSLRHLVCRLLLEKKKMTQN